MVFLLSFITKSTILQHSLRKYCSEKRLPNVLLELLNQSKEMLENSQKTTYISRKMDAVQKQRIRNTDSKYAVSRATLQVLGSAAPGSPKALYLFTDHRRYLFNCGEGMQRLAHEHKVKIARLEHIFFTSSTWSSVGGLPGTALTLQDVGVPKITLHGPPGLDELFAATKKFVVLKHLAIETADCASGNCFEDNIMTIHYIKLKRKNPEDEQLSEKEYSFEADNTSYNSQEYYDHALEMGQRTTVMNVDDLVPQPRRTEFSSVAYVCRIKPCPGTLDIQKCVLAGIKPGPLLGQLKNGEDVTLPDGRIIYSKDVTSPDKEGAVFIVMEVPDIHYLDSLESCDSFEPYFNTPTRKTLNIPSVIVHFTPDAIMQNPRYQSFMNKFDSSATHLILNDGNSCFVTVEPYRVQNKLHLLHKTIFPLIEDTSAQNSKTDKKDEMEICEDSPTNVFRGKTFTIYNLRPHTGIDRSQELKIDIDSYIAEAVNTEGFPESLEELKKTLEAEKTSDEEYPKITFLGTGSCIPNKTRNTSGIMIHTNENSCFLMDCGEGTYGQMIRHYGNQNIEKIMRQLKGVYVSHLHADHHLGLLGILLGRKKAFENQEYQPLYLFAPFQIMSWLALYDKRFEKILDLFTLIPNLSLVNLDNSYTPVPEDILLHMGLSSISTCMVKHCPNSFGVCIVTEQNKKITYSGDTMPCDFLVLLGEDSDLLIHEATMEDELLHEAVRKMHSTTSQAISIGKQMKAKHVILTHFSQRYARIPRPSVKYGDQENVGIAFDNMEVRMSDLPLLSKFNPCLRVMFAEHFEELANKAEKRAMKRSRNRSLSEQTATNVMELASAKRLE